MLAASCLAALPGAGYREAAQTLKGMAERATTRRREQGLDEPTPQRVFEKGGLASAYVAVTGVPVFETTEHAFGRQH